MSRKKEARQREENAAVAADIQERLATLKEKFTAAKEVKDPAKKILELLDLSSAIRYISYPVTSKVDKLAHDRAVHTAKSRFKQGALVLASLPIVTMPFTMIDVAWYSKKNKAKKQQELRELLNIDSFEKTVNDYQRRTREMLDDTVKNCDLKEVIRSPDYSEVLHRHEPLKKRFEAVAFARAAFGDDPQQPQSAVPENKPGAPRSAPSYPELKL